MRGAQIDVVQGDVARGIIPADAGSTALASGRPTALKDHPRGCGEHATIILNSPCNRGSSPRMRGAHGRVGIALVVDGIIPADAGSTCGVSLRFVFERDHPRGCGEHLMTVWDVFQFEGSSPRMRGAR